jgi:CheY-like chemotaxis protein/Tfp pilus assembly protein PilF
MKLEFESSTSTPPFGGYNYSIEAAAEENNQEKISLMLQAGIKEAQDGNRNEARQLLIQVTEADPRNETAWLWMASISEYPEELIIFLNNVLEINPNNARALEWMQATKSLLAGTLVQRGVDASNDVNMDFARQCFLQAIVHDPENEMAWFWLASISDTIDEKIAHLQKVLNINPENETAKSSLQTAKNQIAESVLRKANSAAIAGDRETAREMLAEAFKHAPEMEEAWILKSYLADSFSEKITCFEKVLTLNPENEMAISGLASLRAMIAKTEAKKVEQAAMLAQREKEIAEQILHLTEAQITYAEGDENNPTQALEYPPAFMSREAEKSENEDAENEPANFSNQENAAQSYDNLYQEETASPQPILDENSGDHKISAKNDFMNSNSLENQSSPSEESADTNYNEKFEPAATKSFENSCSSVANEVSKTTEENLIVENHSKSSVEIMSCPFCNAENDQNAFVCASCRTVLTLSDLEMLLAHAEADRELLRQTIERMEIEKNQRDFTAKELKNLAIGHINLKNLREGVACLQKAAQMNPNDVVLGSKVNFLKIRLSEIEQQASNTSQSPKNRKILIVDDSATVRKLISSKLEKSGHEVVTAVDGVDALEKIKEFTPDLILLDIMMPQLDGYQVCKLIRTNESTKDVPIVMISGKDGFFDKVRGRMAGTTGYITKPFGPETLMRTVETYIVHRGEAMTDGVEE